MTDLGGGFCLLTTFSIIIIVLAETGPGLPGCTVLVGKAGLLLLGLGRAGFPATKEPGKVFPELGFPEFGFREVDFPAYFGSVRLLAIGFLVVLAIGRAVLEAGRASVDVEDFPEVLGKGRELSGIAVPDVEAFSTGDSTDTSKACSLIQEVTFER